MILNVKEKHFMHTIRFIHYFKRAFIILLFKALDDDEDVGFGGKIEIGSISCNISKNLITPNVGYFSISSKVISLLS
jgi:hypothetical protein